MSPDASPPPPSYTATPAVYPGTADGTGYARRVNLLGILFAVFCVLYLIGLLYFIFAAGTIGTIAANTPPPPGSRAAEQSPAERAAMYGMLMALVKVPAILAVLCSAIAAVGLLTRQAWGRIATIIVSVPLLILFPLGTILGAYAIYLMVKTGSKEQYERLCASKSLSAAH